MDSAEIVCSNVGNNRGVVRGSIFRVITSVIGLAFDNLTFSLLAAYGMRSVSN